MITASLALCVIMHFTCSESDVCYTTKEQFTNAQLASEVKYPDLLIIAGIESTFVHEQTSRVGAYGLFQIMPITEKHMNDLHGLNLDRHKAVDNIYLAQLYWEYLLARYSGDTWRSIVAYGWGPSNADRIIRGDITRLPLETRNYLEKFKKAREVCQL